MKSLSILKFYLPAIFFSLLFSCNSAVQEEDKSSKEETAAADSLSNLVDRGKYLAYHVALCMDCHSERDWTKFSGPLVPGTEGRGGEMFGPEFELPGMFYASNITPDSVTGIGTYNRDELTKMITLGIRPNGDTLFPIMPFPHYNGLTREDVDAVLAYIATLKPVQHKVPPRQMMIPASMAYPPLRSESPEQNIAPDVNDYEKRGEYLVNAAVCMDCHTPMDKGQFVMTKYLAGGRTFKLPGFEVTSSNITPDSATGIGKWSEAEFVEKFTHYRDPSAITNNPGKVNTIMPWTLFSGLTNDDLRAIYAYLRSIPPVKNAVLKFPPDVEP